MGDNCGPGAIQYPRGYVVTNYHLAGTCAARHANVSILETIRASGGKVQTQNEIYSINIRESWNTPISQTRCDECGEEIEVGDAYIHHVVINPEMRL